ncbi:sensor histidine kinase [Thermoleophilia bacterium SCSIO 60948]|nr:sensor histidine kinase [Thermoleophilia bacterium SCSIO 60948]
MTGAERSALSERRWVWDLGAVALAIGVGVLVFVDSTSTGRLEDGPLLWVDVAIGLLGACLIPLRHRYPAQLAFAFAVLGFVGSTSAGAGLVFLYTAVKRCPTIVSIPLSALSCVTVPVYASLFPDPNATFWTAVSVGVATTLAVVAWGFYSRTREQLLASLTERAERAESEQRLRVEQAQVAERGRIAREMHDVLAHRLSLLSLHASALEVGAKGGGEGEGLDRERLAEAARVIRGSAHDALEELRGAIGVLRDDSLADGAVPERPQPSLAELDELIAESRQAGMALEVDRDPETLGAVPPAIGRHAYRVAQEGLTNARKHAPGCAVEMRVAGRPGDGLEVEVRNRMPLGPPSRAERLPGSETGLVGLAERAALAGGRLEHGPTPDGDFRLSAWFPWSRDPGVEAAPGAEAIAAESTAVEQR